MTHRTNHGRSEEEAVGAVNTDDTFKTPAPREDRSLEERQDGRGRSRVSLPCRDGGIEWEGTEARERLK